MASNRIHFQLLVLLTVASLSGVSAQASPGGAELVHLFRNAFPAAELGVGRPGNLVMNLSLRWHRDGRTRSALTSVVIDYEANRFLNRTCVDGQFRSVSGYADGSLDTWLHELRFVTAGWDPEGLLVTAIDYALTGPRLLSGRPTGHSRFVDYGVIAGEEVTVTLADNSREVRAIFSHEGLLLGEVSSGQDESSLLAVLDGLVPVDGRMIPLGWTFYDLSSGSANRLGSVRIWDTEFDRPQIDSLLQVRTPPMATSSAIDRLQREVDDLFDGLGSRGTGAQTRDALVSRLLEAFENRRAVRRLLAVTCPGPL